MKTKIRAKAKKGAATSLPATDAPVTLVSMISRDVECASDALWVAGTVLNEQNCDLDQPVANVLHVAGWQRLEAARETLAKLEKALTQHYK